MIASLPLALVLSVVYLLTGLYALLRWAAAMTGPLPPALRTAELSHVLMSVAMLAMTWTMTGPLGTAVQIVAFTVFAAWFLADALRRRRTGAHGCSGGTAHALMAAAMVWMLAGMSWIMPATSSAAGGSSAHAGHAGHTSEMADMPGMGGAATTGTTVTAPAAWAVGITVLACVALVAVAAYWLARAVREGAAAPGRGPAAPIPAGPAAAAGPGTGAVATLPAAAAPAGPAILSDGALRWVLSARSAAVCHVTMSLGMVAMLAAMVAGW